MNGRPCYTTKVLESYSFMFFIFENQKNLFDQRKGGLPLGLPRKEDFLSSFPMQKGDRKNTEDEIEEKERFERDFGQEKKIELWLSQKKQQLKDLKLLLRYGKGTKQERQRMNMLLLKNDYLFLHFPDGYAISMQQDFLNRVAGTIDFFAKYFDFQKA